MAPAMDTSAQHQPWIPPPQSYDDEEQRKAAQEAELRAAGRDHPHGTDTQQRRITRKDLQDREARREEQSLRRSAVDRADDVQHKSRDSSPSKSARTTASSGPVPPQKPERSYASATSGQGSIRMVNSHYSSTTNRPPPPSTLSAPPPQSTNPDPDSEDLDFELVSHPNPNRLQKTRKKPEAMSDPEARETTKQISQPHSFGSQHTMHRQPVNNQPPIQESSEIRPNNPGPPSHDAMEVVEGDRELPGALPGEMSDRSSPVSVAEQEAGGGILNMLWGSGKPATGTPRDKAKEEIAKLKEDNRRLKEELRKTNYNAQHMIDGLHRELDSANGNCRLYIRTNRDLQHQVHRGQEAISGLQHELSNVTRKYDDAKALSDTRGKELIGAQVFLTKADSVAISDLVQTVNALNEEIFQAAASVGEAIVRKQWEMSEEEAKRCYATTSRYLGSKLAEIVHSEAQKPDGEVNPLLVQVILHVLITRFCVEKINVWAPNDPVLSDQLLAMYGQIWSKEEQAVSGRWRALTRGQLRPDVSDWGAEFAEMRTKIMMTAAWDVASEDQQRIIENQIAPVFKSIVDARIALGEKFTSADIEIFIVEDGGEMDPRFMEEEYGDDGAEPSGEKRIVAATSRMGLKKPIMNAGGQLKYEIVLAPKVVIEASMKAVLEPVQTTRSSRKKRR